MTNHINVARKTTIPEFFFTSGSLQTKSWLRS